MEFANPATVPAHGIWPRMVACMERHGDEEGWVARSEFLVHVHKLRAKVLVSMLNEHQDALERRVVWQEGSGRPREEFRLKREA